MSAPRNNRNSITSGTHSFLATGRWPKGASYVTRLVRQLRRALDAATLDQHGEITIYQSATIQTACRHEVRAMLLQRWLRNEDASLSTDEKVRMLAEIGKASDARDRCLKALGLDQRPNADPWSTIDSIPLVATETNSNGNESPREAAAEPSTPDTVPFIHF